MARAFDRLSSRVLITNDWHRYCADRYVQRDGSEGDYFYVDMPGSSVVVPELADGRVVLLRVRRYLLGCSLWEFPIGGLALGDDPLNVAKKELAEESGYRAARWDRLGVFAPYKGVSNERCHVFLARDLERGVQELEASEDIEVHVVELAEARRRVLGDLTSGESLGDGQSLAALAFYDRHRDRG